MVLMMKATDSVDWIIMKMMTMVLMTMSIMMMWMIMIDRL